MNKRIVLLLSFFSFFIFSPNIQAQLEMKLQATGVDEWGVFVRPIGDGPSGQALTGSGQVTVVMPAGFQFKDVASVSGLWQANSTYNSPADNPSKKYVSFGLLQAEPTYPISYETGEETLLFTFKRNGDCPDTLYLIDCNTSNETDPFCPPNVTNSNPGNDLQVFDVANFSYYFFYDNYAPMAWNCSDNDGDGIPNGMEDTNGNGVYDPGIDASNINDPSNQGIEYADSVALTVRLLSNRHTWGVYMQPVGNFLPTEQTKLDIGKVTIAASAGFQFKNLKSYSGGSWVLENEILGSPNTPVGTYFTFGLDSNGEPINLGDGEVLLFTFSKDGICPDELYIHDEGTPDNIQPSQLEGLDEGVSPPAGFVLAGVYESKSPTCLKSETPQTDGGDGFSGGGEQNLIRGKKDLMLFNHQTDRIHLFPNPAAESVTISGLHSIIRIEILNLNGNHIFEKSHTGESRVEVKLSNVPAGIYFIRLSDENGRVVNKRLIKQ